MIGTVLAAATLAAAATPADARSAYAQRQFLLDADDKCHLLGDRERAALAGSAQQARGALLRAGLKPDTIQQAAADRAEATPCTDQTLRVETETARAAFSGWAARTRQEFPGEQRSWRVSRYSAEDALAWTLAQDLGDGFSIGLVEDAEQRLLAVALPVEPGAARPRTLLLEFRDPQKWPDFVDPTLGGLFAAEGQDMLAARSAPPALSRRAWTTGPIDGSVQAPGGGADYLTWALPERTMQELAALDPRDVARVSIEYADNRVRVLYMEIGDLAVALGFLAAGESPSTRPSASAGAATAAVDTREN